ncbi:cupin domain-containing protein [Magnetovirga frankeli]|uniref:cupin domain-containing protein n=1 Tax=Magnetovirga frankeli TaxID=947516 RepID=UPI001293D8C0|nr:cupin domain-containing protein [gamma proteobacterium SS-5]
MNNRHKGNIFQWPPDASQAEQFEMLLSRPHCRIERILSQGQCSAEGFWYDQAEDEWVLLLKGQARLEFAEPFADGESLLELAEGDYLLIPAHCRHRVAWTDPGQPTYWLAFFV